MGANARNELAHGHHWTPEHVQHHQHTSTPAVKTMAEAARGSHWGSSRKHGHYHSTADNAGLELVVLQLV